MWLLCQAYRWLRVISSRSIHIKHRHAPIISQIHIEANIGTKVLAQVYLIKTWASQLSAHVQCQSLAVDNKSFTLPPSWEEKLLCNVLPITLWCMNLMLMGLAQEWQWPASSFISDMQAAIAFWRAKGTHDGSCGLWRRFWSAHRNSFNRTGCTCPISLSVHCQQWTSWSAGSFACSWCASCNAALAARLPMIRTQ